MKYTCNYCNYTGKEGEFLEGECPACCRDVFTGKENKNSIPKVFYILPDINKIAIIRGEK